MLYDQIQGKGHGGLKVAQLLSRRATKLLDRNHLYSPAISRSVTEL